MYTLTKYTEAKNRPMWDRCYDFLKFSPKISAKKLAFLTQNKAKLFKILTITLVFEKKCQFFRRKLSKIAENCDHNIDPRSPWKRYCVWSKILVQRQLISITSYIIDISNNTNALKIHGSQKHGFQSYGLDPALWLRSTMCDEVFTNDVAHTSKGEKIRLLSRHFFHCMLSTSIFHFSCFRTSPKWSKTG
jgi:hypothetical protein